MEEVPGHPRISTPSWCGTHHVVDSSGCGGFCGVSLRRSVDFPHDSGESSSVFHLPQEYFLLGVDVLYC